MVGSKVGAGAQHEVEKEPMRSQRRFGGVFRWEIVVVGGDESFEFTGF